MKTKITYLLVVLITLLSCKEQKFDKVKLDKYFNQLEKHNMFMGNVSVLKNNKIIYSRAIGFSNFETKQKANTQSKYRIGSISKTFTSALIFKAIEQGKLSLNQTIDKFFPNLINANKITIEHLLYHRSGIKNYTNNRQYSNWCTQKKTKDELLNIINAEGVEFEPNTKANYSNSNYVLLTYVLENVFNQQYANLLNNLIVKPLNLKNTYYGKAINVDNNECLSYNYTHTWQVHTQTDMSVPQGAGAIVSTSDDLVQFSHALFSGKIISQASLDKMQSLQDRYGAGLFMFPFYNHKAFGHTGGIDAFTSSFSYFKDADVSYAMVCNGSNYNNNDVSIAVLSAVFNRNYKIPEFKTYTVKADELDKYLGKYTSTEIPFVIHIKKENDTLIANEKKFGDCRLIATDEDEFNFYKLGIVLEFNTEKKQLLLTQNGRTYKFVNSGV